MGFFARRDIRLRISSDTDGIWTCLAAGACFLERWEASSGSCEWGCGEEYGYGIGLAF